MSRGNKGFAQSITGDQGPGSPVRAGGATLPPRTGILGARENRLASLASGGLVTRTHELVDPARCRIWEGHNRDYSGLDAEACADLIESLRAQGRQEIPAIVRRVTGDPACDFEVVCGARRHWSVTWLRAHDRPELRFLVEPRELSDEEAFRVSDLENRSRRDLSDHERATDYARAIERYYDGNQARMAERLQVTASWLSRYLELARLPEVVLHAFTSPRAIGISHAGRIGPLLRTQRSRELVLEEAQILAADQALRRQHAQAPVPAATVVTRLAAAGRRPERRGLRREAVVRGPDGMIVARGARARGGPLVISIPTPGTRDRPEVLAAVAEILDRIAGPPSDDTGTPRARASRA